MTKPLVAVSGPPGSGKSTAGRIAAETLGLEYVNAGVLFRAEAQRRGVDLADFGRLAERDPSIDRSLDETMVRMAQPGRLLDGRLSGALCRRRGIELAYVLVTAREEVRYARLAERDGTDLETTRRLTKEREESERRRYWQIYQIDLEAEKPDLRVDSSDLPADAVAQRIVRFVRARGRGTPD